jgi:hypothetical protein
MCGPGEGEEGVQYVRGGGGAGGGGWVRCSGGRRPLTLRLFGGFWPGSSWLEAAGTGSESNTCDDGSLHVTSYCKIATSDKEIIFCC